ncbi:MAG TPA: hypothetical protein VMV44_13920, partial [Rectinemataceae bacterium]|nr:hypothetical protein [Rectinemataceae bacterium]
MKHWRRAGKADLAGVEKFLRGRESRAAGLIARLHGEAGLRLPSIFGLSGLWIRTEAEGPVEAAALGLAGGLWFVQLPSGGSDAAGLALALAETSRRPAFAAPRPSSIIGPASSVAAFEAALGLRPAHVVDYDLMERGPWPREESAPQEGGFGPDSSASLADQAATRSRAAIGLWKAGPADLGELLPLQAAYEMEEVVTPLRGFDEEACRSFFARNLALELIVAARLQEGGRCVGKAGTNARAFTLDQIGGVFVLPELRGRGIAAAM